MDFRDKRCKVHHKTYKFICSVCMKMLCPQCIFIHVREEPTHAKQCQHIDTVEDNIMQSIYDNDNQPSAKVENDYYSYSTFIYSKRDSVWQSIKSATTKYQELSDRENSTLQHFKELQEYLIAEKNKFKLSIDKDRNTLEKLINDHLCELKELNITINMMGSIKSQMIGNAIGSGDLSSDTASQFSTASLLKQIANSSSLQSFIDENMVNSDGKDNTELLQNYNSQPTSLVEIVHKYNNQFQLHTSKNNNNNDNDQFQSHISNNNNNNNNINSLSPTQSDKFTIKIPNINQIEPPISKIKSSQSIIESNSIPISNAELVNKSQSHTINIEKALTNLDYLKQSHVIYNSHRESLNQLLNQYIETIIDQHSITFNLNTTFKNSSVNITFGYRFNQILSVGVLPESLELLEFGDGFKQILSVGVLPESLKSLKFGIYFDQILSFGVLPKSLESLEFGDIFNQILSVGVLPESLESLKFGYRFNQILSVGVLPESLESLEFGDGFKQILSVGVLPESLKSLKFGIYFDQILSVGVLPKSLESLVFGDIFNQILSVGVLPKSLESLVFGCEFNQILSVGVLPSSLRRLSLSSKYITSSYFGMTLPQSMITFIIGIDHKDSKNENKLLSNLKTLEIYLGVDNQKIQALVLTNSNDSLEFIKEFYPDYYSKRNLSKIDFVDSHNNQISGEFITALLLTKQK
ncbi:hypothetical protein PPL_08283 [Heterostelium album PN500]|uniref:B box-type domain-containing protein n=1 Tax=Heterostelium pallidum (strain ATCC 26659 / Pp 5 / PN500) TaxID=670386 RepID=D3BHR9_HETP5|nr:hypothetical protein PPL_08283 [Heterostelium album PN500]EFA78819.1 hypothetical protein PPL_08283 [Heterostelium album PN500]|eukprot:XP_020430943.1 hypothetical protein PPL_08283 [Heterostelium album PN500]